MHINNTENYFHINSFSKFRLGMKNTFQTLPALPRTRADVTLDPDALAFLSFWHSCPRGQFWASFIPLALAHARTPNTNNVH